MSNLREAILAAADALEAAREELGALDGIAGDGDHGVTMATAARNVRARLEAAPNATGADLLRQVAMGVGAVGGAIGPIYATAVLRIASQPLTTPVTVEEMARCAEAAEVGMVALGKARPGDKTVLDALHPLVESLKASRTHGDSPKDAALAAAEAAREGAESTAGMIAAIGRASRLGERSRGWADPGATSFAVIVGALARAFAGEPTAQE